MPVTEVTDTRGLAVTKVTGKPYGLPVKFVNADGGAVAPPFTTTWNPADKASNITLSNGNLTVGATSTIAGAVRSTVGKTSGKFYFEIRWTTATGGAGGDGFGIATAAALITGGSPSFPGNGALGCIVYVNGAIFYNTASAGISLGAFINGDYGCCALDMNNQRIWFRRNGGPWNNNAGFDPAANTGGINISVVFAAAAAYAAIAKNGAAPVAVGNLGASAFNQAVPSGFTAGWPA